MTRRNRKCLEWSDAIDLYETSLRARRAAERTLEGHLLELSYLRERLAPLRPDQISLSDLREYQCALLTGEGSRTKKPLSAGTVARVTSTLRAFFAFLRDEGRLEKNPSERLERPKVPPRVPGDVVSVGEAERLLAAPDLTTPAGLRDRAVVELLYATGLRRAEALSLDLSDLDRRERQVTVRRGKGGKGRVVPITRSAYEQVLAYLERGRPALVTEHPDSFHALFLTRRGRRLHNVALLRILRRLGQEAGLERAPTPHTLRRSFASHLLRSGASLRHIQELLGHENLNTTAVYLRLDADELRKELTLRHPRERFDL